MATPNEISKAVFDQAEKTHKRTVAVHTKAVEKQYRAALKDVKLKIASMYNQNYEATRSEMAKFNRLNNLEKQITDELRSLNVKTKALTTSSIKDSFYKQYLYTGYAYESVVKSSVTFGLIDPDVVNASVLNPVDRIKWDKRLRDHTNALNARIKNAVTQGLIQGEGIAVTTGELVSDTALNRSRVEINKALNDRFGKSFNRAKTIIRTESKRAQTMGSNVAFEKVDKSADRLGIDVNKQLLATKDLRTRRQSVQVDGEIANEEGLFRYPDGNFYAGPGLTGKPQWDINDREVIIVTFPDIPHKYERENINEKEVIKRTNFEGWAKDNGITKNVYGQKVI